MGNRLHLGPCSCKEWKEGIEQLDGMIMHCYNHIAAPKYTSPQFMYCPWCGAKRIVDKVYSEKYDSYFNPDTFEWLEVYSTWWKKKNGERPPTAIGEDIPRGIRPEK